MRLDLLFSTSSSCLFLSSCSSAARASCSFNNFCKIANKGRVWPGGPWTKAFKEIVPVSKNKKIQWEIGGKPNSYKLIFLLNANFPYWMQISHMTHNSLELRGIEYSCAVTVIIAMKRSARLCRCYDLCWVLLATLSNKIHVDWVTIFFYHSSKFPRINVFSLWKYKGTMLFPQN